jgi:hypothetical protein
MIWSTYATFESMHGAKSSLSELIGRLRLFSRASVISLCSFIGLVLKLWEPGAYDLKRYDHLISCAFDPLRGDWYKLAARLQHPELVFHRRQLLLLAKLAAIHCPVVGVDAWNTAPGFFGTVLLMANDHFHYGLTEWVGVGELDKVKRLLAEFIPVSEGAGFRPEHKLVRSHLMLKYASQFRCSPNFIDIPAQFQEVKGLSLADYQALCFGLFAKCATFSIEELQRGPSAFTFVEPNFHAMALPKRSVTLFLEEVASTPEHLTARIKHRDYGPNDFTELRKHPLISVSKGFLPIDIRFLVEKFESGPYWAINDIDKNTGDRLRRLWGEVFEVYMNDLLTESLKQTGAQFIPDPRCAEDPSRQVCDGLILQDESLVLLEYKSSMFSAETKYSGNVPLLVEEVEKKLVRDKAELKKKGVEQLADAVVRLFRNEEKAAVRGLELNGVTRVYPLLVTLDGIGGSLLVSRLLNHYFDNFMADHMPSRVEVKPLLCTDVEGLEEVSGCFPKLGLAGFLDYWLSKDPHFMATLTAFTVPELEGYRNERMAREWRDLSEEIVARAFPEEHKAANQGKHL